MIERKKLERDRQSQFYSKIKYKQDKPSKYEATNVWRFLKSLEKSLIGLVTFLK